MVKKVAVITGANSGFGLLMALEFAVEGYHVIAAMRDVNKGSLLLEKAKIKGVDSLITPFPLDVTCKESIKNFKDYIDEIGSVEVLINNAGYAVAGFVEDVPLEEYKNQLETNYFGTIAVTQMVLPLMRRQGFGKIIMMSSISGKVGFPGLSPYVSSKFALEGWSESLRLELRPFSIDVSIVEPGSYQTNIWSTGKKVTKKSQSETSPYYLYMKRLEAYLHMSSKSYRDPLEVAKKVVAIANKKNPSFRYAIGKGVKQTMLIKALLPWRWWEKMMLLLLKNDL
ncbi:SDR family oxidoreductase [Niallia sp. 03091]|uniref:SDR family oxidoreductase n=1 Tax=Niallia sp. 03091 TaxID=3458059 RepID=UPI0040440020